MQGNELEEQPSVKGGVRWNVVRRFAHGILSLGIIYYWLPDPLFVEGVRRWYVLLGAVLIACIVEFVRLKRKKILPGMRSYEGSRIASYLFAIIGVAIVLSISPDIVGIPCIIGMAWCDPLAGELRRSRIDEKRIAAFTVVAYALIAFCSLIPLGAEPIVMFTLIAVMTPLAVLSEQNDIRHLDDDLTMLVVPAIAGTLLVLVL